MIKVLQKVGLNGKFDRNFHCKYQKGPEGVFVLGYINSLGNALMFRWLRKLSFIPEKRFGFYGPV